MQLAGVDSNVTVPLLTAGYDRGVLPHEKKEWTEKLIEACRERATSSPAVVLHDQQREIPPATKNNKKHLSLDVLRTLGFTVGGFVIGTLIFKDVGVGATVLAFICGAVASKIPWGRLHDYYS